MLYCCKNNIVQSSLNTVQSNLFCRLPRVMANPFLNTCNRADVFNETFHAFKRAVIRYVNPRPTGGGAISSPPLVFLRYLLNQCRYHHQTCSTLSPNNFTHCIKILKSRVL